MNSKNESLKEAVFRLFPPSGPYSTEEEEAIKEFYNLVDDDTDLQEWKKYAPESVVIFCLRVCQLEVRSIYRVAMVNFPDLFARLNPKAMPSIADRGIFQIMKRNKEDEGPAVLVLRINRWDPSKAILDDVLFFTFILYVFAARLSPEMQRAGILSIVDMRGLRLAHVRHLSTMDLVKKAALISLKVPIKLSTRIVKGCVLVNSNALVVRTFHAFKWLIPKKLRKKIELTQSDMSYITNLKDPSTLPVEFGGVIDDTEAYIEDLANNLMSDKKLVPAMQHLQHEILRHNGYLKIN
ncbi:Alpha-tocopherol transfer protein [Folsomia candida]|uniref:Alpha-tocopherol transfer protein n=1 Tax=Folsomia candida TaxID=158441 RepID=A0A226D4T4_FOLCA|nr:Alpha-tocopherol transfer protein [Folsomia candida]